MPDLQRLRLLSAKRSGAKAMRQDLGSPIGSTGLSLGGILGVAIGGAVLLLIFLISVFIRHARRKDRRERQRITDEIRAAEEEVNFKMVTTVRPLEVHHPQNLSNNAASLVRDGHAGTDSPSKLATARTRRGSDHKGIFRMRDSWPLVSNIPLGFLPSQSTMTLNQVAPPGYVVAPDSKWLRRSSTRVSRNRVSVPTEEPFSESQQTDAHPPMPSPGDLHRKPRSTSETQLSTILRSTSQRLKVAQRQSLTRTLTTFARLPGSPPKERLVTPPRKRPSASRQELINNYYPEPLFSPTRESCSPRTPSPNKSNTGYYTNSATKPENPSTPSDGSDDSLCGIEKRDSVVPGALTSPSKRDKRFRNSRSMSISPNSDANFSTITQNGSCSPPMVPNGQAPSQEKRWKFSSPDDIRSSSDPFYSMEKNSIPTFPKLDIMGPRPLRARKATFGQEATRERPLSYTSPLRDVSGNAQQPHKRAESQPNWQTIDIDNSERNPFQWTPTDMQMGFSQPSPRRTGSRRKWHKRSSSIRISTLSRPASTISVGVVPEELEEDPSPFKLSLINKPPTSKIETAKSPTPSPLASSRRSSLRPPTAATFSPPFAVPTLNTKQVGKADPVLLEDALDSTITAARNHYTQIPDNLGQSRKSQAPSALTLKARRHGHNFSDDKSFQPPWELEKLISFLPPTLSPKPILPRPQSSSKSSPINIGPAPLAAPAPPLLTIPTPGHLTGPRREPPKRNQGPNLPAPRESLQNSICALRRMNSEISRYSKLSAGTDSTPGQSPKFSLDNSAHSSPIQMQNQFERGRTRGSKHYLSIGQIPPGSSRVRDRPDSHHIYKERQRKRMIQENANLETDGLASVQESTNFPPELRALGIVNLRLHKLSSPGTTDSNPSDTATRSNKKTNSASTGHSLPQTSTKWGKEGKTPDSASRGGEAALMRGMAGKLGGQSRPGSLGLYDEAGFLKDVATQRNTIPELGLTGVAKQALTTNSHFDPAY